MKSALLNVKAATDLLNTMRDQLCQDVRKGEKTIEYLEGYNDGVFDVISILRKQIESGMDGT